MIRLVLMLLLAMPLAARGEALPAAGDGQHVWVAAAAAEAAQFTLWHRGPGDSPGQVRQVEQLRGLPQAVAARQGTLWIIYSDGSVQEIRARRSELDGAWQFSESRGVRLRSELKVHSLQADALGPWALVRLESAEVLASLVAGPAARPVQVKEDAQLRNLVLDLPPGMDLPQEVEPKPEGSAEEAAPDAEAPQATEQPEEPPAEKRPGVPGERLLRMSQRGWQMVSLPEDWPHLSRSCALLVDPNRSERPMLLVQLTRNGKLSSTLRVYTWRDEQWQANDYRLSSKKRWAASLVAGQIVLAQQPSPGEDVTLALSVLRGDKAIALDEVALSDSPDADWAVLPVGDLVGLLAYDQPSEENETGLRFASLDLSGRLIREPAPLTADQFDHWAQWMRSVMFVAVVVLSMLLLFVFWQRDPRDNQPRLPAGWVIGSLSKRATAGLLDLAGPMAAVMVYEHLDFEALYARWPGIASDPLAMVPGLVVIGLFLAHVMLCELLFSTTLGKKIVGLKVGRLDGSRPRVWQVLVRNLLKVFDLMAQLLLLLPLLSPMRQRLGDLVAQTLVIMPAETEDDDEAEKDETNDDG